MTVYELAKALMKDEEFNKGGISKNERKYFDKVGFEYTVKNGCVASTSEDVAEFYKAMYTLLELNNKYSR